VWPARSGVLQEFAAEGHGDCVTYGGVANPPWYGGRDVIGFTAETVLTRSDFGMDALLGPIGDAVTVTFSGEFLQDS
jgi:polyisoprenoid-binding protein YceI